MQLSTPLTEALNLKDYQKKALKKIGLKTVKDLLWYFPSRYQEVGQLTTVADIIKGENVTLSGKISNLKFEKTWRKKMNIARAILNDGTGQISLVWFHQPFIANILKEGATITVSGKAQSNKTGHYLANPTYSVTPNSAVAASDHSSVYSETRGISTRWLQFNIQKILKKIITENPEELEDFIPQNILKQYKLPSLKDALLYIHTPKETKNAEAARKRFSFEEIFLLQLSRLQKKKNHQKKQTYDIEANKKDINNFVKNFSFKLTPAQNKAVSSILEDIGKGYPMSRFLEGDVGSGKTAIAAVVSYAVLKNGYQTAYMAPTEVLAKQLFESFIKYFTNTGAKIGLLTSSESRKFPSKVNPETSTKVSKNQLLKWLGQGELDIVIGTHSLIQDKVKFSTTEKVYKEKKLALVIIDEQHRFGTNQRAALTNKKNELGEGKFSHLLSMSATPIPRTLALTIYGDLDLTVIDKMPPGRKKIITEIVPPKDRQMAYEKIREEIKNGKQAYVICPRIEAAKEDSKKASMFPALAGMKAVKEEHKRLSREIFPEFTLDILYGKMTPKEKEKTMENFENGKTDILIATSVVEVGVNVPNATTIIIEGAERFGLAQLHQLRGRVLRSSHQPYCFIFAESKTKRTMDRLKALTTAKNGFELAEYDLEFRGPGELSGKKQWGISDVGMEALKNIKMVETARTEAEKILEKDSEFKNYPLLKKRMQHDGLEIHME